MALIPCFSTQHKPRIYSRVSTFMKVTELNNSRETILVRLRFMALQTLDNGTVTFDLKIVGAHKAR